MQPFMGQVAV
jgi:hypothetical protein